MKSRWNALILLSSCLAFLGLPVSLGQQNLPRTVEQLEQLAPEQRNELQQKKVRFDQLTELQRQQYRDFNQQLNASGRTDKLRAIMRSYTQWLLSLDSEERQRIQALPVEERLQEVVHLVKAQREQRFKELLDTNLSGADLTAVAQWYDRWLVAQTQKIDELGKMIEDGRTQALIAATTEDKQRATIIVFALLRKHGDSLWQEWFQNWDMDVTDLIGSMSETAEVLYASAESDQQRLRLVLRWGYYSFVAQSMQAVTDDELLEFYRSELSNEDRNYLDRQPPQQVLPILRRFYFQYRMPEVIQRVLSANSDDS